MCGLLIAILRKCLYNTFQSRDIYNGQISGDLLEYRNRGKTGL
uniref:Uncharacterized protein n=1 Tax=Rhizophora mucronata TaxID=61149 RepID=A0A2P2QEH1_RHIMU